MKIKVGYLWAPSYWDAHRVAMQIEKMRSRGRLHLEIFPTIEAVREDVENISTVRVEATTLWFCLDEKPAWKLEWK